LLGAKKKLAINTAAKVNVAMIRDLRERSKVAEAKFMALG
jgi:hypothetical protein